MDLYHQIAVPYTSKGHFLNDIIGYDRLKLYLKIYTTKWNPRIPGYATDCFARA